MNLSCCLTSMAPHLKWRLELSLNSAPAERERRRNAHMESLMHSSCDRKSGERLGCGSTTRTGAQRDGTDTGQGKLPTTIGIEHHMIEAARTTSPLLRSCWKIFGAR